MDKQAALLKMMPSNTVKQTADFKMTQGYIIVKSAAFSHFQKVQSGKVVRIEAFLKMIPSSTWSNMR